MKRLTFLLLFMGSLYTLFAQEIDSIIDIRDDQVYKVVKIGQQWWMQESLNIGTRIDDNLNDADNGIIEKYCYDNKDSMCTIYGGLYQWEETMDYSPSDNANPGTTQGICPVGWHVPPIAEFNELDVLLGGSNYAGGKLKEAGTSHWAEPNAAATNESGFTALPGGFRYDYGNFAYLSACSNLISEFSI